MGKIVNRRFCVKHTFVSFVWATWEFCSESGADAHQDSRVTTQTRCIFARPLKNTVVEPLNAALCDPFIAARVVTVEMCVSGGTCNKWSHHVPSRPIGTHLNTANHHCFLCSLSPYPPVVCTHPLHSQCLSRRHAPTH